MSLVLLEEACLLSSSGIFWVYYMFYKLCERKPPPSVCVSVKFLTGNPWLPGSPLAPGVLLSLPGSPYET